MVSLLGSRPGSFRRGRRAGRVNRLPYRLRVGRHRHVAHAEAPQGVHHRVDHRRRRTDRPDLAAALHAERVVRAQRALGADRERSEEHTSELQSLMRISYAVFCLKKKKTYNLLTTKQSNTSMHKQNYTKTQ